MTNPKKMFTISRVIYDLFLISFFLYILNVDEDTDFNQMTPNDQWNYVNNILLFLSTAMFLFPLIDVYVIYVQEFYDKRSDD